MKPTDELYYRYAGVISSVAYKYAQKCPAIADDLLLQARYIFCKACLSYKEDHNSGASFETWLRNQLQALSNMIDKEVHGPSFVKQGTMKTGKFKDGKEVESKVLTPVYKEGTAILKAKSIGDKVDCTDILTDMASNWYLSDYNENLSASDGGNEYDEFPPELLPYIKGLTGDAYTLFQDFCAGCFDPPPQRNITKAKQKTREILNPLKMYRRKYMDMGWSLDRVKYAWKGLHGMLRNYMVGKLPCMALPQEAAFRQAVLF